MYLVNSNVSLEVTNYNIWNLFENIDITLEQKVSRPEITAPVSDAIHLGHQSVMCGHVCHTQN